MFETLGASREKEVENDNGKRRSPSGMTTTVAAATATASVPACAVFVPRSCVFESGLACGGVCCDDGCGFCGGFWMRRVVLGLVMVVFGGVASGQSTGWPVGPGHAVVTLWPKGAPGPDMT